MRFTSIALRALQAGVTALFLWLVAARRIPLGVRGEWEWLRISVPPSFAQAIIATVAIAAYATFAAWGRFALDKRHGALRETIWTFSLALAAIAVQWNVIEGSPYGYGLSRWGIALGNAGSSGYYRVARGEIDDPTRFLADYPKWIQKQDELHIGTHPPGLLIINHLIGEMMDRNPAIARFTLTNAPRSARDGLAAIDRGRSRLSKTDRAALVFLGALTLLLSAFTVIPLYALARVSTNSAATAWTAASLWPFVPSAILFQPIADSTYPFIASFSLLLAVSATTGGKRRALAFAAAAGVTIAGGMILTLAFLPIGLIAAIVVVAGRSNRSQADHGGNLARLGGAIAIAIGFLTAVLAWRVFTHADLFTIWYYNLINHARFYVNYHRTYSKWVWVDGVEFAIALGISTSILAILAATSPRRIPAVGWGTIATLIALDLSGRNLGEIARLWLPFMPPFLIVAAVGLERIGGRSRDLATTIALVGLQTLCLEQLIQTIYPV